MKALITKFHLLEEGVLAATLLGLALMAFVEVVSRYLFNHSYTWFEELSRYLGVFMTFLGASLGVKYGTHFSMDLVIRKVGPRTAGILNAFTCLVSVALFGTIAYMGSLHVLKLKKFGVKSAAMQLPMYIAYLPIAVFSISLALRFALQFYGHMRIVFSSHLPETTAGKEGKPSA